MRRAAFLFVIGFALGSCASPQQQRQEQLKQTMDTWLGHSIADYALRFGPPLSSFDMGNGRRAFQWQATGQTPGVAVPISGMLIYRAPQQTSCMVSFVASNKWGTAVAPSSALPDWIIEQWSYQGNC